jgi:predicted dithiol-disulfide oxidoreductase (DUF899 family)
MSLPAVVSQDEWLVARKVLLAKEKQLTRERDTLNAERRRLPMVEIHKEYVFDGPEGKATLLELFEGRHQLIIYHLMWLYGRDLPCPSCSWFVDQIGHLAHLHASDTTFAAVRGHP